MVGTAQADSFAVFIRKIGYSVGVEYVLQRASDFARAYAAVSSFRESDWDALVHGQWKLRSSNASANVADVFHALDIALIQNHEIYPGSVGEALGVLSKMHPEGVPSAALQLILGTAIVRADGDVFLNALRSDFDEEKTGSALIRMIQAKRETLFRVFVSPRDRESVARAVTIERQRSNRGSSTGGGLSALTRSAPLGERAQGLGLPRKLDVHHVEPPSRDYLRKITASRKGWAESLGLFSNGQVSEKGEHFLLQLAKAGFARTDGTFVVWPTAFEVESNQFQLESFHQLGLLSTWELHIAVFRAFRGIEAFAIIDPDALASSIAGIFNAYRQLSQHRSMIRNEVPGSVVAMVLLGEALARGHPVPNLSDVWDDTRLSDRGITVRPSRTIEFAISVCPDARQIS